MQCIETDYKGLISDLNDKLNLNMQCIETEGIGGITIETYALNLNMQCIETLVVLRQMRLYWIAEP